MLCLTFFFVCVFVLSKSSSLSCFSSLVQMVMEFPDNVLNLDGHQNNSTQLKQFIQVNDVS